MLGILTNYHYDTFALDDLALITDFLNGRFNFHLIITIPFLFCTPCYTPLGKIVDRNLDRYLISGEYPDIIHSEFTRDVGCDYVPIGQLYLKGGVGQRLKDRAFKLHYVVLSQNYPSKPL